MCGIVGILAARLPDDAALARACAAIRHRGPDAEGVWTDREAGIALGHRRLSILDLSPAGAQPMHSRSGRYVIAYNGEVYNHLELRERLDGPWRGHSDTETLLAAIEAWGVEKTLESSVGMFAFALWDRRTRTLVLARDRFGEKPLYYGTHGGAFMFASELAALHALPDFRPEIDREALAGYMHYAAVPGTACIYAGFRKLEPGAWVEVTGADGIAAPRRYWDAYGVAERGVADRFGGDEADALDALDGVLRRAVRAQMISDVPLGALLSGGLDSSTIVALMQAQSEQRVRTFSIGFHEPAFNEAEHARRIAAHLGTEHEELYVTADDARELIPRLPSLYSEPFADVSQIPTLLVSEMARRHVTVALSGDGGDELFGGYTRYLLAEGIWRRVARIPRPLRTLIVQGILAVPPAATDRLYRLAEPALPAKRRLTLPGDKIRKGAQLLAATSPEDMYRRLTGYWAPSVVIGGDGWRDARPWPDAMPTYTEQMMARDTIGYLHDDILVKVDRAAMSVSLETRIPFLDHRVYEFAWTLPLGMKVRDGQGKWILRELLCRYVPRDLVERPKMGFAVPIGAWLQGPLREWAEDLLDPRRLASDGFLDATSVRKHWDEHQSGRRNHQYLLWTVLMFQAWLHR